MYHNCDHQNTIRILAATSPASVTIDGVVKLRMEEEGMGARPPISCYSTIRCMLMVMFGSAITIIIMIVLIINGCTSSSSGTLWINSLVNLPGWITCTESGRKYFQSLLDCDNSRTDPRGTPDGPPDRSLDRPNWIEAISQYATMPLYYINMPTGHCPGTSNILLM